MTTLKFISQLYGIERDAKNLIPEQYGRAEDGARGPSPRL